MPAPIVNASAKIMCAHGGQVTLIPKQVKVLAGGAPVLCVGDLVGAPIVGCAQPPTPATAPCLAVASEIPIPMVGMNPQILVGGKRPAEIPNNTLGRFTLLVNIGTARRIGLYPPMPVLGYAEVVGG